MNKCKLFSCFQAYLVQKLPYCRLAALKNRYKNIIIDHHSEITTICINRPDSRNSLNAETIAELSDILRELDKDEETKGIVLGGEGGSFCSGFDLKEISEHGYEKLKQAAVGLRRTPLCDKPTVCAVSGFTVAEGLELALACDLRVIEETATLGWLGRRFGAPSCLDGSKRLAYLVGAARALDLTMTGRHISGETAHAWGLAARLVATGTALGQSLNLAMSLPKFPKAALMVDKLSIVNEHLDKNSDDYIRNELLVGQMENFIDQDVKEGAAKFKQGIGRHGNFKNLTTKPLKSWEIEDNDYLPKRIKDESLEIK